MCICCTVMVGRGWYLTPMYRHSFILFQSIEHNRVISMPPEKVILLSSWGCCATAFQYKFLPLGNPIGSPCPATRPLRCISEVKRFEGILSAFCSRSNFCFLRWTVFRLRQGARNRRERVYSYLYALRRKGRHQFFEYDAIIVQ